MRRLRQLIAAAVLLGIAVRSDAQAVQAADALVGRLVPTFAWPDMEDSTRLISPLSLQGRVVLLDLWGTWCAPCRREMPFLHAAYDRFHPRGLEIVSIAFDVSPGKVLAFRREQFPMPWQHVYATYGIEAEATRLFHAESFPRAVLIGRDGTVLRVDTGLRGPALATTLDSLFAAEVARGR
jgi:thiol-disulfide isomerase/thioredoxin